MQNYPSQNMADPRPNILRTVLMILAIAIVITTVALIVLSVLAKGESQKTTKIETETEQGYDQGYKDGYNAARNKLSAQYAPSPSEEVTQVFGTIKSIDSNRLNISTQGLNTDERIDGVSDLRTVTIEPTTRIIIRKELSPKETADLLASQPIDSPNQPPPPLFTDRAGSTKDLKEGMKIQIKTVQDIRLKESFTAQEIIVRER